MDDLEEYLNNISIKKPYLFEIIDVLIEKYKFVISSDDVCNDIRTVMLKTRFVQIKICTEIILSTKDILAYIYYRSYNIKFDIKILCK